MRLPRSTGHDGSAVSDYTQNYMLCFFQKEKIPRLFVSYTVTAMKSYRSLFCGNLVLQTRDWFRHEAAGQ